MHWIYSFVARHSPDDESIRAEMPAELDVRQARSLVVLIDMQARSLVVLDVRQARSLVVIYVRQARSLVAINDRQALVEARL